MYYVLVRVTDTNGLKFQVTKEPLLSFPFLLKFKMKEFCPQTMLIPEQHCYGFFRLFILIFECADFERIRAAGFDLKKGF